MMVPYRGELGDPTNSGSQGVLWTQALIRYMNMKAQSSTGSPTLPELPAGSDYSKHKDFFYMCPDSPIPVTWRAWGNYAVHPTIMAATPNNGRANYPIARVKRPSQVIIIADGSQSMTGGGGGAGDTYGSSGDPGYFNRTYNGSTTQPFDTVVDPAYPNRDGQTGWIRYRHNNVANCLYLDGHVKGNQLKTLTYANFIDTQ